MSGPHAVHYSGNLVIILTVGLGVYDVDYAFDSKLIAVCLCASIWFVQHCLLQAGIILYTM